MIRVERSALMPFAPSALLELVRDVESYPEFIPGCIAATARLTEGPRIEAGLQFRFAGLTESFVTENIYFAASGVQPHRLQMRLLRGPFKSLSGEWCFQALGDSACKISLTIELEWGAISLGRLLAPQMDRAVSAVMQAFTRRADERLGRATAH